MRKLFLYSLVIFCLTINYSCSTGNYSVNPNAQSNSSYNPLNTSPSKYDWSGASPISCNINGAPWVADPGSVTYSYASGYNMFGGNSGGHKGLYFWFNGVYPGNTYTMGYKNGSQYIAYVDSPTVASRFWYYSYNALFGTGGVQISRNDTFNPAYHGYIEGKFYFEGIDSLGRVVNVSNGYFNIQKW